MTEINVVLGKADLVFSGKSKSEMTPVRALKSQKTVPRSSTNLLLLVSRYTFLAFFSMTRCKRLASLTKPFSVT